MFPIGDDNPTRKVPFVTLALIVINVVVFLRINVAGTMESVQQAWLDWGYRVDEPFAAQLLTYQFLHSNWLHILNNLWMLWIFGDNVEDKLGHGRFAALYLVAGACAAWAFSGVAAATGAPPPPGAIQLPPLGGASGSVFGVMGIYLVFFPEARVRILLFFFLIVQVVRVRAKWVIGIWIALEMFRTALAGGPAVGHIATAAHVGGGVFGVLAALWLKPRVGGGGKGNAWDAHTGFARTNRSSSAEALFERESGHEWFGPPTPLESQLVELEDRLVELVERGEMERAIDLYPRYEAQARERPLPGSVQIEIAHEYYERHLAREAAEAYLRYMETDPNGPESGEAAFRVGILFARELDRPTEARAYLEEAAREHPDATIRDFAEAELRALL